MTKQEAIEKSYRETKFDWDTDQKLVNENGECEFLHFSYKEMGYKSFDDFSEDFITTNNDYYYWIPRSIKGIQDNNGWIKIEDGLPDDYGDYKVLSNGHEYVAGFSHDMGVFHYSDHEIGVSHWKKYIPDPKPLY